MKYLRTYENLQEEPQVGDYVICEEISRRPGLSKTWAIEFNNFLKSNIGQVVEDNYGDGTSSLKYVVCWEEIPQILSGDFFNDYFNNILINNCRRFLPDEIKYCAKTKKELVHIIDANKYNL